MTRNSLSRFNIQLRLGIDSIALTIVCHGLYKSFKGLRDNSTSPLIRLLVRDGKRSRTALSFVGGYNTDP